MPVRNLIQSNFSKSATTYDSYAIVQMQAASHLFTDLQRESTNLPAGDILEIGCGTGFLTIHLAQLFPDRQCEITDIAPRMLDICKQRPELQLQTLHFREIDAESFLQDKEFALVASSFALQWLPDSNALVRKIVNHLKPGGKLIFSVPSDKSFPEWKAACRAAGVPYTGNQLPDMDSLGECCQSLPAVRYRLFEDSYTLSFPSILEFFRSLKMTGASTQVDGIKLTLREFHRLVKTTQKTGPDRFVATYHVLRAVVQKL
jgi:malonyl-CoA O-methyltransferase